MKIPFNLNFLDSVLGIKIILFFEIVLLLMLISYSNFLVQTWIRRELEGRKTLEGRETLGAFSREEQGYFTKYSYFAYNLNELEVPLKNKKYYQFRIVSPINFNVSNLNNISSKIIGVIMLAVPQKTEIKAYTYPYIGAVFYDTNTRTFSTTMCRGTLANNFTSVPILSSNIGVYPYQTGKVNNSKDSMIDNIFPCPSGFEKINPTY